MGEYLMDLKQGLRGLISLRLGASGKIILKYHLPFIFIPSYTLSEILKAYEYSFLLSTDSV
jgi:hypothetical protein